MQSREFIDFHLAALETNEVRHNVALAILGRISNDPSRDFRGWTLGLPGQCAVQTPPWPIMLCELEQQQCRALAEQVQDIDYPAVVGPDLTAEWLVTRATELGSTFLEPIPQQIHALSEKPKYPGVPGNPRPVTIEDASLFADWIIAFAREATPHDPAPAREALERVAGEGRHMFWAVDGQPVSLAGIVRRTRNTAAIAGVYTPPSLRGRGYAGSVTAAVVERVFEEGRSTACLYTDLRNPFSNRCYAKIGFKPVCSSWHFPRERTSKESQRT
jgi:RimJ/RimL family protein N-acetyltransferase